MGKLTISTGPFSIAMLNYQRVDLVELATCSFVFFTGWWLSPTPLKNMSSSNGFIVPNIWKNIRCSKPPTSSDVFSDFFWSLSWTFPFITSHHCGGLIWNAHVRPKKSSTALLGLQAPRLLLDPWPPSWKPFVLVTLW